MSDADKQKLHEELQKGLEDKQKELVDPLKKKLMTPLSPSARPRGLRSSSMKALSFMAVLM